jgi:hypothetical protein
MCSNLTTRQFTTDTPCTTVACLQSGRICSLAAAKLPTIMTENSCGFPQSVREISKQYFQPGHYYPNPTFIYPLSTSSFQFHLTQYSQSKLSRVANLGTDQSLLLKYGPATAAAYTRQYQESLLPSQLPLQHDITRTDPSISQSLGPFAYSRKAPVTFVISVSGRPAGRPSVRPPARIRSAPTGRLSVISNICDFYEKLSRRAKFG